MNQIDEFFEDDGNRGVASVAEAARLLDVDEQELRRAVRAGGTFRRVGTSYVLDHDDVMELADEFDACGDYAPNRDDTAEDADDEDELDDDDDELDDDE